MSSRAAPPRALVLAVVVAVHAGVLALLIAETRSRLIHAEAEAPPLIVMLLPAQERQPPAATASPAPAGRLRSPAAAAAEMPPVAPAAPDAATDWAAQGMAAATRAIEADEQRARQGRALAPKSSLILTPRARRPEFHWDYAHTHRVEALPGLATAIHLNDECTIVLFLIVPFAGGCALEKAPARGDLFEHMHDPEPAADP